jgi:leucyl aminopeptidase
VEDGHYLVTRPGSIEQKPWMYGGELWREIGAKAASSARALSLSDATVYVENETAAQAVAEGAVLGDYRFITTRSGKAAERSTITIRVPGFSDAVGRGMRIAEAQNYARTLADLPPNLLVCCDLFT